MSDFRTHSRNGVDLEAQRETVAAVEEIPKATRFRFGTESSWIGGGRSRSRLASFYGAGRERRHERTFVVESDLPAVALGTDRAACPSEYVLVALASCLVAALAYRGAERGVRLRSIRAWVTGEVDLGGLLGPTDAVCREPGEIRVVLEIAADATDAQLDELVRVAGEKSLVRRLLTQPVPVRVVAERSQNQEGKEQDDE